ncbi:MAG: hypothetical protein AAF821_08065 [Cyanobacteria bacterium P01_D01_bin.156]
MTNQDNIDKYTYDQAMEILAPPEPPHIQGMPSKATAEDISTLKSCVDDKHSFGILGPRASIALAAARFTESCEGGGFFKNNCAHFLANAFILAGYDELTSPQPFFEARCYFTDNPEYPGCNPEFRRPVRAREMEKWFQLKATQEKDLSGTLGGTVQKRFESIKGTGFWAVFQQQPGGYWGGHVCIIDTETWTYYGTGRDGHWGWETQHLYQW